MEVLKRNLTYPEFRQLEFDDNDTSWYELINGELVKKQSPTFDHQRLSKAIFRRLDAYSFSTDKGEAFYAPLDVVLDDGNSYIPDLFFIKKERSFIMNEKERLVTGAPDLVVEILSKSTAGLDKGTKKENYEKYGVREYWLVDPLKKFIEVYALVNERYKLVCYLEESGVLKSTVLEGFEMDMEKVFAEAKL